MKKFLKRTGTVLLVVAMLAGTTAVALPQMIDSGITAEAAGTTDEGFEWEENEDGDVTITGYTGDGGEVVIPSEIDGKSVSIDSYAFRECTGLTSVTIPDSVTSIGWRAFYGCTGLTNATISAKTMSQFAFQGCTGLTDITITDSVISISMDVFAGCTGLTSVTIPDSVTSISDDTFSGCTGLTEINVGQNNENYTSEDGVLFDKDKTALLMYPAGKKGAYTIPDSVTEID